ncbi:hypothetical protein [Lacisediminimonas profundi]|uniref:hypothetical protein n=1 Tax=Lacisediminimonas profundi TaxID=2603856 RepID=UPI00124BBC48|nr:hypothetical protein [Lacisediminimonas profundi]
MTASIAAAAEDLDATHEVIMGLFQSLDLVTNEVAKNDARITALTCAMHHYLAGMAEIIEKVRAIASEESA